MSRKEDLTEDDLKEIVGRMLAVNVPSLVRTRHAQAIAAVDALRLALLEAIGQPLDGQRPDRAALALMDTFGINSHEYAATHADILSAVSGGRESAWIALADEYLGHASGTHADPAAVAEIGDSFELRQQHEYMLSEWRRFDERLSEATGLPLFDVLTSGGDAVIDWIERVKALLPDDVMFADSGLPDPAALAAGGPRP